MNHLSIQGMDHLMFTSSFALEIPRVRQANIHLQLLLQVPHPNLAQ